MHGSPTVTGAMLGERLMPALVKLLGPAVSYGKGAIVGVAGALLQAIAGHDGCKLWVKSGHLPREPRLPNALS